MVEGKQKGELTFSEKKGNNFTAREKKESEQQRHSIEKISLSTLEEKKEVRH